MSWRVWFTDSKFYNYCKRPWETTKRERVVIFRVALSFSNDVKRSTICYNVAGLGVGSMIQNNTKQYKNKQY